MQENTPRRTSVLPVYIALGILVVFGVIFAVEFLQLSESSGGVGDEQLTPDTYLDIVEPLLVDADPAVGEELVELYGCTVCHGGDNAGRLAPGYTGLSGIAEERRPPLTAEAYVYEAIIYPGAHTVEGYTNNMPRIYDSQITDDDLGDIIAYILSVE